LLEWFVSHKEIFLVEIEWVKGKIFVSTCIAATIEVEILFAAKQAKRLERKA
jgi:hypothetical protein